MYTFRQWLFLVLFSLFMLALISGAVILLIETQSPDVVEMNNLYDYCRTHAVGNCIITSPE